MARYKVEVTGAVSDEVGWYPTLEVADRVAAAVARYRGTDVLVYVEVEHTGGAQQWELVRVHGPER